MCDISSGVNRERCKNAQGGYKNLYPFNAKENPFTVVDGVVTAIDASLTTVYKYELEEDQNSLTEDLVGDRASGTTVNTQNLTAVLKKITAEKSNTLNGLAYSYPMAVAEDWNGVFHAVGIQTGIDFSVNATTGAALSGDLYGYTVTGVSKTGALSPKLDADTITAFLALVAE